MCCSAGAFAIGGNLSQANLPAWGIGLQLIAYFGGVRHRAATKAARQPTEQRAMQGYVVL